MKKLQTIDTPNRWEAFMARRKATKALRFINESTTVKKWDAYELQGEL